MRAESFYTQKLNAQSVALAIQKLCLVLLEYPTPSKQWASLFPAMERTGTDQFRALFRGTDGGVVLRPLNSHT